MLLMKRGKEMKFAIVYLPTATVMATRATEVTARSRANYIADRLGFANIKVVEVSDSVKKGDMMGLDLYRPHWADIH